MSETNPTQTREQLIEEISIKLAAQPQDIDKYRFYDENDPSDGEDDDDILRVQCTDGNTFDCYGIWRSGNRIMVWMFSSITGDIETDLDNISTASLQDISDEICPPRTLTVTVQYRLQGEGINTGDILLHSKTVLHNFTEEQLLEYLQRNFPTFDWQADDADQYVYYPDPTNRNEYVLGSCYRESYDNYPLCN